MTYNQKIYAVKNKSEQVLKNSSSGGVFYELAESVISDGGVVYGAAYTENMHVKHYRIESADEIALIMGSKYMQSDMADCFRNALDDLKAGKTVLFSGTPCQIAGLKKYISTIDNSLFVRLITVDIVCHGAASPGIFEWHLRWLEHKYNSKLTAFTFRCKNRGRIQAIGANFENGKEYYANTTQDLFYKLFSYDYIFRNACYNCRFTSFNREGDISLADFWGYKGNIDKTGGISLVLINSEAGEKLFNRKADRFETEASGKNLCMQRPLFKPCKRPFGQKLVLFLYRINFRTCLDIITNMRRTFEHFKR